VPGSNSPRPGRAYFPAPHRQNFRAGDVNCRLHRSCGKKNEPEDTVMSGMTHADTKGAGCDDPPPLPADSTLDIRADTCPMTFVRTRLALDRMAPGQVLRVHLKGEEPRRNIPRTAAEQGHQLLAEQDLPGGEALLWLRRR
jgi:tRNA 2-thiouridine synthesizing protein A